LRRQLRSGTFDAFLTPLPGAEAEVERIVRHFPGDASAIVTGGGATEAAYESQAGQYGIVHFATHAVASDGQPFYSTLILAPDSAPGHDGFLQAFEVLRTPLQANLVVLSGCETAMGAEDLGQGLVGLVAAFQQAGARSVLATLWSIDEATAEVMAGFYDAMASGASTPAALRQAKLQLLKQRLRIGQTDVSLAHPFFWAPFILIGAR
jgi:CHAT domain-containing protein